MLTLQKIRTGLHHWIQTKWRVLLSQSWTSPDDKGRGRFPTCPGSMHHLKGSSTGPYTSSNWLYQFTAWLIAVNNTNLTHAYICIHSCAHSHTHCDKTSLEHTLHVLFLKIHTIAQKLLQVIKVPASFKDLTCYWKKMTKYEKLNF